VARSVELNGNVFVIVSWWKYDVDVQHGEGVKVTLLFSNGETSIL